MAEHSDVIDLRAHRRAPSLREVQSLAAELRERVRGEVRFDPGSRALYARDASNFRMPPIGVVLPRDAQDVISVHEACRERGVPLLSRGGGTSLAGQCCNVAVVMDFSKYMNRVIHVDPSARLARVEPGCILDALRRETGKHHLTLGPDPATHDHCTLGGMIGNNSCGVHAVQAEFYGPGPRMQDNVHELEVLTYDGVRMRVGPTSDDELERIVRQGGRKGEIYRKLRDLRDRYADEIRQRFPDIPRRVSGYNLECLLPENGFNVAQALVGTEATCVTILEATVKLIHDYACHAVLVLGFEDVYAAGDAIPAVRDLDVKPIGCEGLDRELIRDIVKKKMHEQFVPMLPSGDGWLLVQFGGDTKEEAREKAEAALSKLGKLCVDHRLYTEEHEREGVWEIRESGLGATAFVPGQHDTWPGWEDSAVPPEKVGAYLRDLHELYGKYGYSASLYGHFAQGCIHTRIPFELSTKEGIEQYRRFTREAAELCLRYGGSLSGEHGDGQQRGDLLPMMFGREIMQAFREFKAAWDPDGKMNPGKLVDALPRTENLALGADYDPWRPDTHFPFADDEHDISHATLRCVGVGKCRREEIDEGVMCPSYFVTHEEKHTTRGRAHLLFEMLRGEVITDGWKSEEVKESLDLCLACKGCTHDCPVNVDMPTLKAEFLSHYYEGRLRPRHAYAFGLIHRWARLGAAVPELTNFVTQTPLLRDVAKWAADVHPKREIPKFAARTFRSWYREHAPTPLPGARRVILWVDTFNNFFHPDTLAAAADALVAAGFHPVVPERQLCCGRPLYDYGMMSTAKTLWHDILADLSEEILAGTPVVGVEPSCTAAFRDELSKLFPNDPLAKRLSAQTHSLTEILGKRNDWTPPKLEGKKALIHVHCHHQGALDEHGEQELLEKMGIEHSQPQKTCCGMAGAFGFERDKYDVSMAIGELALLPKVRDIDDDTLLVADGFSCREQVRQGTGKMPLHIAEVLELARREQTKAAPPAYRPSRGRDAIARSWPSAGAKVLLAAGAIVLGGLAVRRLLGR